MSTARPKKCRQPDCDDQILIAFAVHLTAWIPLEARDVPAYSLPGALVLVNEKAWRPGDLIDEWQATRQLSEPAARALVGDYPFHQPHRHDQTEHNPDPTERTTTR